ncbi:MAG: hypothetical protein JW821_07805 [Deltaproteobacteria bacterium]|nr:hypothetical protein [Deltaproteobacteria bacterium]
MPFPPDEKRISSKEILELKGISRATLNNYVKMGILPKPVVRAPLDDLRGIRKIGYFPVEVLDRIDRVTELKRQGYSMENIARRFSAGSRDEEASTPSPPEGLPVDGEVAEEPGEKEMKLTIEDFPLPAYLLNYRFEILWVNPEAQKGVLKHKGPPSSLFSKNIFKFLFTWEFHTRVQNWKDLVSFHMRFAKIKYTRGWMENLYEGISAAEIHTLQEIYNRVSPFPRKGPGVSPLNLLRADGTTESFQVISIFFKEGILFIYSPSETLYPREPGCC